MFDVANETRNDDFNEYMMRCLPIPFKCKANKLAP
jgi:hypothetical protein